MHAPAPSRSTMKLVLNIGLVSLALDVFSAVEESSVRRSTYVSKGGTLHKAGMTPYDTITGETVDRDQLAYYVELPEGDLVEMPDDEMQALLTSENGSCTFIGFIKIADFNYSIEKPYQCRPQRVKTKTNPFEKPFALILAAMARSETVALLSFVARGKTKYAALGSDGALVTLRFDEEVREERPLPTAEFSDAEVNMGVTLIESYMVPEVPVFTDEDSAKIMEYAAQKAKAAASGESVAIPVQHTDVVAAPADDLMAMLAASVRVTA